MTNIPSTNNIQNNNKINKINKIPSSSSSLPPRTSQRALLFSLLTSITALLTSPPSASLVNPCFSSLRSLASHFEIGFEECITRKVKGNARKYPVEVCRGKSGKYTAYSDVTGVTKDASTHKFDDFDGEGEAWDMEKIKSEVIKFVNDRDWNKYHTIDNLKLALTGELGELCEIFQWNEEVGKEERERIGMEIADVAVYLIRICQVQRIEGW